MSQRFFNEKWSAGMKAAIANMTDAEYSEWLQSMEQKPQPQPQPGKVSEMMRNYLEDKKQKNDSSN